MPNDSSRRITICDRHFSLGGRPLWLNGVNTPWQHWNDFGGRFDPAFWDGHFSELRRIGVNATRIWINCDGFVGIQLDADGAFLSVSDKHWQDLDTLFALAQKHGLYIMPTLLSFDHFKDVKGKHMPWRRLISDPAKIRSFVDGYVIPFVQRYGGCEQLFSIDLMNEPDWVVRNPECGQLPWENLSRLFACCTAAIHQYSDILVTVGMGMILNNSDRFLGNQVSDERLAALAGTDSAYLDFWSPHFYQWEAQFSPGPFGLTPEAFGLDGTRPAVIGECAAVDETGVPLADRYEAAWREGWDGVFAWTSNGVDKCGGFEDIKPAAERMLALDPERIKL